MTTTDKDSTDCTGRISDARPATRHWILIHLHECKCLDLAPKTKDKNVHLRWIRPPGHLCEPLTVTCTPGLSHGLCRSTSSLRRYLHQYAQNDQSHELCHSPTDLALSNENVMEYLPSYDEFIFTVVLEYVLTSLESGHHQAMTFQSLHILHHQATPGTAKTLNKSTQATMRK